MKKFGKAFLIALLSSLSVLANEGSTAIQNSDLSDENQAEVASAIRSNCGFMNDLSQAAPTVEIYDYQEVGDVFLKITLSGWQRFAQFDHEYMIYVDAVIPAVFSNGPVLAQVTHVRCEMK